MSRTGLIRGIVGMAVLMLAAGSVWAAGGSSSTSTTPSFPAADPRATAQESYERGLGYRDKAWELEAELEAGEGKSEKLRKKIDKQYRKAIRAFESAVEADPTLYQAHSSLGYALRRVGEYQASLAAYDRALELEPNYAQAIEYRAEAYLGLGRIEEAKEAYMRLFRGDSELASQLLSSMEQWVERRRDDPSGVATDEIEAFAAWVEERAQLAEQAALVPDAASSWQRSAAR